MDEPNMHTTDPLSRRAELELQIVRQLADKITGKWRKLSLEMSCVGGVQGGLMFVQP